MITSSTSFKFKSLLIIFCTILFSTGQAHAFWWLLLGGGATYYAVRDEDDAPKQYRSTSEYEVKKITYISRTNSIPTEIGKYYVTARKLNVRLSPEIDGKITNKLDINQLVEIFELKNNWARISNYYNGDVEGVYGNVARWVHGKYLSKNKPQISQSTTEKVQYSNSENLSGCISRGIAYFKIIGSYPTLSDGRSSAAVARDRCGRTLHAFDSDFK